MATTPPISLDKLRLDDEPHSDDDSQTQSNQASNNLPAPSSRAQNQSPPPLQSQNPIPAFAAPSPIAAVPPKPSVPSVAVPSPTSAPAPGRAANNAVPNSSSPAPPHPSLAVRTQAQHATGSPSPTSPRGPAASFTSPAARAQLEAMRAGARVSPSPPVMGDVRPPPHGAATASQRMVRPMGGPMGMRAVGNQPLPSKLPPSLQAKMDAVSGRVSLHPRSHLGLRHRPMNAASALPYLRSNGLHAWLQRARMVHWPATCVIRRALHDGRAHPLGSAGLPQRSRSRLYDSPHSIAPY